MFAFRQMANIPQNCSPSINSWKRVNDYCHEHRARTVNHFVCTWFSALYLNGLYIWINCIDRCCRNLARVYSARPAYRLFRNRRLCSIANGVSRRTAGGVARGTDCDWRCGSDRNVLDVQRKSKPLLLNSILWRISSRFWPSPGPGRASTEYAATDPLLSFETWAGKPNS